MKALLTALALLAAALLSSCAVPGAPRPPSLRLPRPVSDLEAVRKGERVLLSWTPPVETTDGETIREPGMFRVCRSTPVASLDRCFEVSAPVPDLAAARPRRIAAEDQLVAGLQEQAPLGCAEYVVETLNAGGRGAGPSNRARIFLAPTLPPPADLRAVVAADGIYLSWTGRLHQHELPEMRHRYRVSRRTPEAAAAVVVGEILLAQSPEATLLDSNFEWEKTYLYRVAVVTVISRDSQPPIEVEGADSAEVEILAHDSFPPAVPTDVEAVFSGSADRLFVDLTWSPGIDADLAGYRVYRREAQSASAPVRLNAAPVTTPAFRDADVQPGRRYLYSVSAVDLRGNESARSEETGEDVP